MRFNIGILFIATVLLLGASADDDSDDDNVPDDVDIDDDNDGIIDAGWMIFHHAFVGWDRIGLGWVYLGGRRYRAPYVHNHCLERM